MCYYGGVKSYNSLNMPFDIESARQAITSGQVKIKKGEGIAHALMRVVDQENANK
jgi:hypothetical protein